MPLLSPELQGFFNELRQIRRLLVEMKADRESIRQMLRLDEPGTSYLAELREEQARRNQHIQALAHQAQAALDSAPRRLHAEGQTRRACLEMARAVTAQGATAGRRYF